MNYRRINDYGVIGNKLSAALVSSDGCIDWCCLPRFDSPSVFAAILDSEKGGRFWIKPSTLFSNSQAYLPGTNILVTTFATATGKVTLTDFMPCYENADTGLAQPVQIHRILECTEGEVEFEAFFEPRPDYAREDTRLGTRKYGVIVQSHPEPLSLSTRVPFALKDQSAHTVSSIRQGERAEFVLHYGEPLSPALYRTADRLEKTRRYWEKVATGGTFYGLWYDTILRSYLALHLLVYQPQGAIIAAPTTSLPEEIGGERNWDYRYAWLRDTSLTLSAFSLMGYRGEAAGYMNWLARVCRLRGPEGQTLYGIGSNDPPEERTLTHLSGYMDSRPVRIGNDAYHQRQHDIFGEVLEAAHNYMNISGYISRDTWQLLRAYVLSALRYWREPDSGIWEVRSPPAHFVHSKLICWVAIDRGIKIARHFGYENDLTRWEKTATRIRNDVLRRGWNARRKAFTQHYETEALDASVLLMPAYGLLPSNDERMVSTLDRIQEGLDRNGLLLRYDQAQVDDGLKGKEGAFLACSTWLIRNLIRLNRLDDAVNRYERLLKCGNHLGLFAEMADPSTDQALGNFPLALTHLNLIITGLELNQATLWGW